MTRAIQIVDLPCLVIMLCTTARWRALFVVRWHDFSKSPPLNSPKVVSFVHILPSHASFSFWGICFVRELVLCSLQTPTQSSKLSVAFQTTHQCHAVRGDPVLNSWGQRVYSTVVFATHVGCTSPGPCAADYSRPHLSDLSQSKRPFGGLGAT